MDLHAKSEQLLQKIANSLYDREPQQLVFFSVKEMHVIEQFLLEYEREIRDKLAEY